MALNLTGNDIIDTSIIRNSTQTALNGSGVKDFKLEDDTIKLTTTDDEFSVKLPSASNVLINDDIGTKVAPLVNGVVPSDNLPSNILTNNNIGVNVAPLVDGVVPSDNLPSNILTNNDIGVKLPPLVDGVVPSDNLPSNILTNNDIGTKLPPLVDGRIPTEYMPEQALIYKGTWNASTNTPTITNGVGTLGDFYICNVPGTWSSMEFSVGDWVLYNGSTWEKSANQIPKYNPSGTAGYVYGSNDEYSSVRLGRAIYLVDDNGNNIRILKTDNGIQVDYLDGNTPIKSTIIADLDGTAYKVANALTVNGKTYDGSSAVDAGVQTVANGGTGVTTQADINKAFIGNLAKDNDDVTDGTEFVSSYASDNGFAETAEGALNKPYKRQFIKVWNYIKNKISSVLGLTKDTYGGKASKAGTADKVVSAGSSGMWIQGRANAICKTTSAGEANGWKTLASIKTSAGSIEIGNLAGEDNIRVVYSSDANVNAANNNVSHIMQLFGYAVSFHQKIYANGGIIVPTSAPSSLENGSIWIE